ncbi:unnamed protein product [Adineta ricciae]|uniref:Uncharacterized protein n=1 Tax=Adineta ricciae TaxID=249248 RepID=A0A814FQ51_ADIRI|nr:unnamed protein product [Adineta ricciae]CAF1280142.1 unnamed protein product [Adineta ricciae]
MSSPIYHTVPICPDLPKTNRYYSIDEVHDHPSDIYWISQLDDEKKDETRYKVRYTVTNGSHTSANETHAIFSSFLFAYNSHEDIVLSPDDIWLMVCIYFSQYVNDHAEQLRKLFVDHEDGRKRLTIVQTARLEPDWEHFLAGIRTKIDQNVKTNVVDLLSPQFSTTTAIESLLSSLVVMSTCQKYFDYECYITKCGIRNVHFLGTLDDWKLLRKKIQDLKKFSRDSFVSYINAILPVIDQFIDTYQGNVDQEFWNKVMDIEHVGGGKSGKMSGTYISGWFLRLCYGLHSKSDCEIKQIKLNHLKVAVEVNNEVTNESKTCYLLGGLHGIDSRDERHKPVMSLAVIDDLSTIRLFKREQSE